MGILAYDVRQVIYNDIHTHTNNAHIYIYIIYYIYTYTHIIYLQENIIYNIYIYIYIYTYTIFTIDKCIQYKNIYKYIYIMCIGSEAARNDPLVVWSQRDPLFRLRLRAVLRLSPMPRQGKCDA